jgi:hypothetical protein
VALSIFLVDVATSSAADAAHDPTKVGDNIKGIVMPNAKSFWILAALGAAFAIIVAKKTSRAGGVMVGLFVIGLLIWNPLGVQDMMDTLAHKAI